MYDFKKRSLFSIGPHLLGLIFMAVGFFTIVSPWVISANTSIYKALLIGLIFLFFGLLVVTSYSGILFDFKEKRYKKYYALMGFRFGHWDIIPPLTLVKVFSHAVKGSYTSNGINPTATVNKTLYVIAMYGRQSKPAIVLEYDSRNRSLEGAKIFSQGLNLVLDIKE